MKYIKLPDIIGRNILIPIGNPKNQIVIKAQIHKAITDERGTLFYVNNQKVINSKHKDYPKGRVLAGIVMFKYDEINQLEQSRYYNAFTNKERCIEYLRQFKGK